MPKTPDEIKKGLERCADSFYCDRDCPYYDDCNDGKYSFSADALALIQQLQDENAQQARCIENMTDKLNAMNDEVAKLQAERDAAVEDMKHAAIYLCCVCENYHPAVRGVSHHYCEVIGERADFTGAISCGMFKWRGVQKED